MKIEQIEVINFRSLKDVVIQPQGILALVGRNNSGKSNLLEALEIFFEASTRMIDKECFHNLDLGNPISIIVTFSDLTDWEKDKFSPWMQGELLVVEREVTAKSDENFKINTYAHLQEPEPEWLRAPQVSGKKIKEWWDGKDQLVVEGLDFGDALGTSRPNVSDWKTKAQEFIEQYEDRIPFTDVRVPNPSGYPNILKGALPEFVYIPAVRDVTDEATVKKSNPFGKLINSIFKKIPEKQTEEITEKIEDIENLLAKDSDQRLGAIDDVEEILNNYLKPIMDCDLEIVVGFPNLREVVGETQLYADDGIRTSIETKGHGLQRAMIFSILRAYAELSHVEKAGAQASERTTIFAIEEPELYLHPQLQRTLMSVLREISESGEQIIYSTHSSLFVNISYFDEICILRKKVNDGEPESVPTQLTVESMLEDLKVRKGTDGSKEGLRELYSNIFNPVINEGFFADKVIIVEGPSEEYAFPIYAEAYGIDFDRENISVVHADGKGSMDRLVRVFNGFEIPTFTIFDGDKYSDEDEPNMKNKTEELLGLHGEHLDDIDELETTIGDNFAVFENKLEDTLKEELENIGNLISSVADEAKLPTSILTKPIKNRFIARQIKDKVNNDTGPEEALPETIFEILTKIENLEYTDSVLKTEAKESS